MQDVKEPCERIIIIDQGAKAFDGPFSELVTRFSDEKLIRLKFDEPVSADRLAPFGPVEMPDDLHAVVRVPRTGSAKLAGEMLTALPVADITVDETEADEVIRQVFAATTANKAD